MSATPRIGAPLEEDDDVVVMIKSKTYLRARVAELVDALVSGTSA
jgi:hypothetical protein